MNADKDYYSILGVLPSIEAGALAAVYRALLKKYHPDVYDGDTRDAERITKQINEAYGVLGDLVKRSEYDKRQNHRQQQSGDYESESGKAEGNRQYDDEELAASWSYIARYYPDAERCRLDLAMLSAGLALSFQVTLLETKTAGTAKHLGEALKRRFLERYFGTNVTVHGVVIAALSAGRRDVALEINRAIKILGSPDPYDTARFLQTVRQATGWGLQEPPARSQAKSTNSGTPAGAAHNKKSR